MLRSDSAPAGYQRIALDRVRQWKSTRPAEQEEDVEDLSESLRRTPQLQNIVVRRAPDDSSMFELIAGNRRVAAARKIGWTHIDGKVVEANDLLGEVYALEENLRRKNVANETEALSRLLALYESVGTPKKRGGDRRSRKYIEERQRATGAAAPPLKRVALVVGQSERTVRRKVKVGQAGTPELNEALRDGRVRLADAERIANLSPAEQSRVLLRLAPRTGRDPLNPQDRVVAAMQNVRRYLSDIKPGQLSLDAYRELCFEFRMISAFLSQHSSALRGDSAGGTAAVVSAAKRADAAASSVGSAQTGR